MVAGLVPDDRTTAPRIDPATVRAAIPGWYLWDPWPVMGQDGRLASFDERILWMALSAPDHLHPDERHHVASLRAALAEPFGTWHDAGPVFTDGRAIGSRQWAGSAVYDAADGRLTVFYTAAGTTASPRSFEQNIVVSQGSVAIERDRAVFDGFERHEAAVVSDGLHYRHTTGGRQQPGFADAFRDPFVVRDPASGEYYLLFTASLPDGTPDYDGCIGLAKAADTSLTRWQLLPPLLEADGVNKELERPHLVVHDDRYYLFLTTHWWTFAPGLHSPEGLYGFVADHVLGPYRPLNVSGLVIGNPPAEPHQAYSWLVMPDGWVASFVDHPGLNGRHLDDVTREDPGFTKRVFGGTMAPFIRLRLDAETTSIEEVRPPFS